MAAKPKPEPRHPAKIVAQVCREARIPEGRCDALMEEANRFVLLQLSEAAETFGKKEREPLWRRIAGALPSPWGAR